MGSLDTRRKAFANEYCWALSANLGMEDYALRKKKLHPSACKALEPFFQAPFLKSKKTWTAMDIWEKVGVVIDKDDWGRLSQRHSSDGVNTPTAVWALRATLIVIPGVLNKPGIFRSNCWDFTKADGFRNLAHEIFHCWQHKTRGWLYSLGSLFSTGFYWFWGRFNKTISIHSTKMEQEAIAFDHRVYTLTKQTSERLRIFARLR